jgi:tRNA (guanine-N7-)-methyltransferase
MQSNNDDASALELRSFGRRRGRKLSPRQQHLLETLLPRLTIDFDRPETVFASAANTNIWIEIGFGGGEHLIFQAENNQSTTIIGCEPFEEGIAKVLSAIDEKKLTNIRLYTDDARDILRALPPSSISKAFVLFPDPWSKKKHQKRRLVNAHLLQLLALVTKPGAELRIATDIADYARTMFIAVQQQKRFSWIAKQPRDWQIRPDDWPETRYEQKARREGRPCCYLRLERQS